MKNKMFSIIGLLSATLCFAQTPQITIPGQVQTISTEPATFIKGTLNISFDTTQNAKPTAGITDKYNFDINVSNAIKYHGSIERLPNIPGTMGFGSQSGLLTYSVDCDLINPKNPRQTLNIGRLLGTVPNDKQNIYRFADGDLKMVIEGRGNAAGFESKFDGLALGKPPANNGGWFSGLKQQAISLTRSVKGQTMTIKVTKYDQMIFNQHILAAGPVQKYPAVMVNGKFLYDYSRNSWHLLNVTCVYALKGVQYQDSLSGDIKWVEAPDRKTSGKGEYQFDIRINEPPPSEDSVFTASNNSDESAFFETDNSIPSLIGTMKYVDTLNGDTTTASQVQVDLIGNKISPQQTAYLAKLLLFSSVVPINSD